MIKKIGLGSPLQDFIDTLGEVYKYVAMDLVSVGVIRGCIKPLPSKNSWLLGDTIILPQDRDEYIRLMSYVTTGLSIFNMCISKIIGLRGEIGFESCADLVLLVHLMSNCDVNSVLDNYNKLFDNLDYATVLIKMNRELLSRRIPCVFYYKLAMNGSRSAMDMLERMNCGDKDLDITIEGL
ncbi:MAG: hypothetical protein GSR72_07290 [Desulfurococcales archaeon]|nr:hypothetical protein [Desulfurococcales archaeon]